MRVVWAGAAAALGITQGERSTVFYHWYEIGHAAVAPWRAVADATKLYFKNPLNPVSHTAIGKNVSAACELFERTTRRYGKPAFGLNQTEIATSGIDSVTVPVIEEIAWSKPFCNLVRFTRPNPSRRKSDGPEQKLLIVAPMSGHYATLLRGTVESMLPYYDVYITDWIDARLVPLTDGDFDLDDYIDYLIEIFEHLGGGAHVMAVCQPSVPVLAAVAVMEEADNPAAPATMTLMGGPIDTRINPTAVNALAEQKDLDWFRRNVIMTVPFPHPGFMRQVYPGFLQLTGFMSMNMDRHLSAHKDFFNHLVEGDGDNAEKHTEFYDEYLAVMDLTAEFYLQTVKAVFMTHDLPEGTLLHRGKLVDCSAIKRVALLTIEGENDDISGVGQTEAAHALCNNLPDEMHAHFVQPRVGHYGVFNGSRYRSEIAPRIRDFIATHRHGARKRATVEIATEVVPARKSLAGSQKAELSALLLSEPRGAADDLKAISGVGPKLEQTLNQLGIFHFSQIAQLTVQQIDELDTRLSFKGRITRDDWVAQAQALANVRA